MFKLTNYFFQTQEHFLSHGLFKFCELFSYLFQKSMVDYSYSQPQSGQNAIERPGAEQVKRSSARRSTWAGLLAWVRERLFLQMEGSIGLSIQIKI